ncbi:MAG TPA: GntR family transcriptional regulator [Solirubrobacterales bacterium]|nr:GntR family transcriptional regulator [Solirubrobacterales bacterium]
MPIRFQLDAASGVPFYRQVIDQILAGIATGALARGERLPTVRALAVELAVNLNTVARAYKELEIRGVLSTQQGSGTFVAAAAQVSIGEVERRRRLAQLVDEFLARAAAHGLTLAELREALAERGAPADGAGS